ncbi:paraquat-inducible protein B [Serratia quinivorans]|uniref:Paraquat-inducible protein B n=1 Tax=Serratia quinivorans TaxID=137545 RepID=A0A380B702_9GAMM|nr:paraquat-inducible protein B [Serratia quinivorans]
MQQETPNTPTEARVKNKRRISPFWLLPFIALLIAGWLVYNNFQERGTTVTIDFQSAAGIVAGRTPVRYQGGGSRHRTEHQPEQGSAQHCGRSQHQE